MIGAAFAVSAFGGEAVPETITTGYAYRRRYVIPAQVHRLTLSDGSLVLPVLVTADWFKGVSHGGKVESVSGHDIRFENDNGTKLPFEIAAYDPITGRLEAWVRLLPPGPTVHLTFVVRYGKAPSLSGGVYTSDVYQDDVYVGGDAGQEAIEADPTATWAGYVASWDMASGVDSSPQQAHLELTDIAATTLLGMDAADLPG